MSSTFYFRSRLGFWALYSCLLFAACKKNKQQNSNNNNTTPAKTTAYRFSYSGTLFTLDTMHFTSTAPSGSKFAWSFGDGSIATVAVPEHIYTTAGTYTVALVVDNDTANTVRQTLNIGVDSSYNFSWSGSPYVGGGVYFVSKAKSTSKFLWTFGDGSTSADPTPLHVYSNAGNYTVSLVLNDRTTRIVKKTAGIGIDSTIMATISGSRVYHFTERYINTPVDTTYPTSNVTKAITCPDPTTILFGNDPLYFTTYTSGVVYFQYNFTDPNNADSRYDTLSFNTATNKIRLMQVYHNKSFVDRKLYETP